ncbi:MAG: hypothetical protein ACRYGP_28270 [Janthinobacterium lividum]
MVIVKPPAGLKARMDIEAALRWAYCNELTKTGALNRDEIDTPRHPGLATPDRDGLGTTVQMLIDMPTNCFGVLQEIGARGTPHPDAIMIGDAVAALDATVMGVPEDWKPLAEMDDLSPEVSRLVQVAVTRITREIDGDRRLFGMRPSFVVQRYALSGGAPAWRAEVPTVKIVSHPNGVSKWFVTRVMWSETTDGRDVSHEVELDGFDTKARRPYGDAYRKLYLDPDPEPAIRARAEYEIWHAALDALAMDLAPRLTSIRLSPTRRPARPWIEGDIGPSVLPDLSDMVPLEP